MGWLWHFIGFDYGLPYGHVSPYDAWSGFLSDIGQVVIVGGLITLVRKHTCEVHRCWRLGRHTTAANHAVCRKHHPGGHLTHADIIRAHTEAKGHAR